MVLYHTFDSSFVKVANVIPTTVRERVYCCFSNERSGLPVKS